MDVDAIMKGTIRLLVQWTKIDVAQEAVVSKSKAKSLKRKQGNKTIAIEEEEVKNTMDIDMYISTTGGTELGAPS